MTSAGVVGHLCAASATYGAYPELWPEEHGPIHPINVAIHAVEDDADIDEARTAGMAAYNYAAALYAFGKPYPREAYLASAAYSVCESLRLGKACLMGAETSLANAEAA